MGPATVNSQPQQLAGGRERSRGRGEACRSLVTYLGAVVFFSSCFSFLASHWLPLTWWKVFRRCVSLGAALSLWLLIKKIERRSFRSYGLMASAEGNRQLAFGVMLGVGALGLLLTLGLVSGTCRISISPDAPRLWRTVIGFLPAAGLISILEEMVFRGFILQHLLAFSRRAAVIISSALYALVHVKALAFTQGTWLELTGLFLLGMVLAISYLTTHQLSLAIGLHGSLAYGARVNKLLIEFPDTSIAWLVGTNRLVNGIVSWIVLIGIGAVLLTVGSRNRWGRRAAT